MEVEGEGPPITSKAPLEVEDNLEGDYGSPFLSKLEGIRKLERRVQCQECTPFANVGGAGYSIGYSTTHANLLSSYNVRENSLRITVLRRWHVATGQVSVSLPLLNFEWFGWVGS